MGYGKSGFLSQQILVFWQSFLSLDGANYLSSKPEQHIYRSINPAWESAIPPHQLSKFHVEKYYHGGMGYWSIHDLLGLFLSSLGPAPDGATKRTFFMPLTAMYGRWCRQIATRSQSPYMLQCTWNNQSSTFFLGANLSGYFSNDETTGTWLYALSRARFNLVDGNLLKLAGWSHDNCPVFGQQKDRWKQAFGNCAECYPLLNMMRWVICITSLFI